MGDIRDLQFKWETSVLDPFVHSMLLLCLQNEPSALDSDVFLVTKALLNIMELRQSTFFFLLTTLWLTPRTYACSRSTLSLRGTRLRSLFI